MLLTEALLAPSPSAIASSESLPDSDSASHATRRPAMGGTPSWWMNSPRDSRTWGRARPLAEGRASGGRLEVIVQLLLDSIRYGPNMIQYAPNGIQSGANIIRI